MEISGKGAGMVGKQKCGDTESGPRCAGHVHRKKTAPPSRKQLNKVVEL